MDSKKKKAGELGDSRAARIKRLDYFSLIGYVAIFPPSTSFQLKFSVGMSFQLNRNFLVKVYTATIAVKIAR